MALVLVAPFLLLHLFLIHRYFDLPEGHWKYYLVLTSGCLVIPFLFLSFSLLSDVLTDALIGPYAGGLHGTIYSVIYFSPFVFLIYWAGIALIQLGMAFARKNIVTTLDSEQTTD